MAPRTIGLVPLVVAAIVSSTKQGEHGSFAIVIQDGVEHGLWQP